MNGEGPDGVLDVPTMLARARASAGPDGRLPLGDVTTWDTFPFEREGLRLRELDELVLPEPPRSGEDPSECSACAASDEDYAWTDERWRLRAPDGARVPQLLLETRDHVDLGDLDETGAAELGRMVVRVERALAAVPGVGRVHVHRWGDGMAHLHLFFLARPEGMTRMRGIMMPLWANHLPPLPEDEWRAVVRAVVTALDARPA